jgi:hypothetical protein
VGLGIGAADADVVELSMMAQGDDAGVVDAVTAVAVVGVGGAVAGSCFGAGGVNGDGMARSGRDRCGRWVL